MSAARSVWYSLSDRAASRRSDRTARAARSASRASRSACRSSAVAVFRRAAAFLLRISSASALLTPSARSQSASASTRPGQCRRFASSRSRANSRCSSISLHWYRCAALICSAISSAPSIGGFALQAITSVPMMGSPVGVVTHSGFRVPSVSHFLPSRLATRRSSFSSSRYCTAQLARSRAPISFRPIASINSPMFA